MDDYREPFDAVGITPPRGRQGHSVPTARPLSGGIGKPMPLPASNVALYHPPNPASVTVTTNKSGPSPAQFYSRRDHTFGGSLSKLDRVRSRPEHAFLESFTEADEDLNISNPTGFEAPDGDCEEIDSGRPTSRQSRHSSDLGLGRKGGFTLDHFTGDSLLHFSYSASGRVGLGLTPDSQLGGSFVRAFTQGLSSSLNVPFLGQSASSPGVDMNTSSVLFPTVARNPNKAIITIDAQTSRILTANEMTCELFGYQRNELVDIKVQSLFTEPYRAEHRALVEQNIDSSGKTILISGKVMDAVTSYGVEFPVSVWMKRVGIPPTATPTSREHPGQIVSRVIVIIEPVERSSAHFTVDQNGKFVLCDPWFACLFGFMDLSEITEKSVTEIFPSLQLPKNIEELAKLPSKQAITGRSKDGTVFPLTVKFTDVSQNLSVGDLYSPTDTASSYPLDEVVQVMNALSPARNPSTDHNSPATVSMNTMSDGEPPTNVTPEMDDDKTPSHKGEYPICVEGKVPNSNGFLINAKVIVYAALSGMISFLPDGTIHGCNHQFTQMLFGYNQQEILKKDITFLIPEFYNHINYVDDLPLPPLDEDQEDLFHSAIERSLSPERAYELVKQTSQGEFPLSPTRKKSADHHRSPARRALHIHGVNVVQALSPHRPKPHPIEHLNSAPHNQAMLTDVAPLRPQSAPESDIGVHVYPEVMSEGVVGQPLSSTELTSQSSSVSMTGQDHPSNEEVRATSSEDNFTSSSSELIDTPRVSGTHSILHTDSSSEVAQLVNTTESESNKLPELNRSHLENVRSTEPNPPVPKRLVSSRSTERIMEILKQHDLQKERELIIKNNQASEVSESSIPSSDFQRQDDSKDLTEGDILVHLSSTPAAKSSAHLQRSAVSPDLQTEHVQFSVGLYRRGSYESDRQSMSSMTSLPEGAFLGEAKHKDGSLLAIVFQLKCITLADDQKVFCAWISRDLDRDRARTADLSMSMSRPPDPYRNDQLISPDVVFQPGGGVPLVNKANDYTGHTHLFLGPQKTEEQLAMEGEYMLNYNTLKPIGKGAFGFVRLAQHLADGTMVVVKFLRKSSVLKDCWVDDEEMGCVPLEISLLARLSHPNIVQLLEAYENESFFQMVMEKHGDGLDLFEFIEMNPRLNEALTSYMFRQIVAGLAYLHERNILHRDVKDENIIVNQDFHLKLIDFGSAAYMAPDKLFNTFCGTLEYCSPEVLLGNSYAGPELEMWALGVTLYTLVFGENPFFDVEETITGHLQPPFLTSPALMKVLFWLLHPDPRSRATLKDLQKDKWTNQEVDMSGYTFEAVLGYTGSSNGAVASAPDTMPSVLGKSNSESDALYLHSVLERQLQVAELHDR